MPQDLVMCPRCGRRVCRELSTTGERRARAIAVEVNVYPYGNDIELPSDRRTDDELDLSL